MNLNKLALKKGKFHKKLRVADKKPGALIKKLNTLPKVGTKKGLAVRGLI